MNTALMRRVKFDVTRVEYDLLTPLRVWCRVCKRIVGMALNETEVNVVKGGHRREHSLAAPFDQKKPTPLVEE